MKLQWQVTSTEVGRMLQIFLAAEMKINDGQ
jgi:hypothetical protein